MSILANIAGCGRQRCHSARGIRTRSARHLPTIRRLADPIDASLLTPWIPIEPGRQPLVANLASSSRREKADGGFENLAGFGHRLTRATRGFRFPGGPTAGRRWPHDAWPPAASGASESGPAAVRRQQTLLPDLHSDSRGYFRRVSKLLVPTPGFARARSRPGCHRRQRPNSSSIIHRGLLKKELLRRAESMQSAGAVQPYFQWRRRQKEL